MEGCNTKCNWKEARTELKVFMTKNISLILKMKRVIMGLCMIITDICKFRKHSGQLRSVV